MVTLATPGPYSSNETDVAPPQNANTTAQGALTVMGSDGIPLGFLNAEEVTAFRTALASSLLINHRNKVKTLVVFGCGKQAYWHVRLALLLRGHTIRKVHFITRQINERAAGILKEFITYDPNIKATEGWSTTAFDMTSASYFEIDRILKERVRKADIIICTTPSTKPLFDHTILTNTEGRRRARLIIAVGSYKPHMIEVPPEIISQALKVHGPGMHYHKRAEEGGAIVVDTLTCLKEAGELVQANVKSTQTVELGELVMLEHMEPDSPDPFDTPTDDSPRLSLDATSPDGVKSLAKAFRDSSLGDSIAMTSTNSSMSLSRKSSFSKSRRSSFNMHKSSSGVSLKANLPRSSSRISSRRRKQQTEREDQMSRWLSGGNVIYKSVGMGLMDLVVGTELVKLAQGKGIGTTIEHF